MDHCQLRFVLSGSFVFYSKNFTKLQENLNVFNESLPRFMETDTNQGQPDIDISGRRFVKTVSGKLAIRREENFQAADHL